MNRIYQKPCTPLDDTSQKQIYLSIDVSRKLSLGPGDELNAAACLRELPRALVTAEAPHGGAGSRALVQVLGARRRRGRLRLRAQEYG